MKRCVKVLGCLSFFLLLIFPALAQPTYVYPAPPEATLQPGVLPGTITKHNLAAGKYYPGTSHNYAVYTPAGYDGSKKMPFIIFLDGYASVIGPNQTDTKILDNLIAKKEIPMVLGIFIDPGVHPVKSSEKAQNRFERHFEYDWNSDQFGNFVVDELLPDAAKKYALSDNPDDRAMAGSSTGAVAAFTTAWYRNDQFHRVFAFIPTFVRMKGADELIARVRKTEPKALRIYMQDGEWDKRTELEPFGTRYAGSWVLNNQAMLASLQFVGYDVNFFMGKSGHETTTRSAVLPDALRWMWRDYPAAITAPKTPSWWGKQPPSEERGHVFQIINDDPWETIGGTYGKITSLAGDKFGTLYFADDATGSIYRVDEESKTVMLFAKDQGTKIALTIGADGRLYVAQGSKKRIVSYGITTNDERVIVSNIDVGPLVATAEGNIYFINSKTGNILRVDPNGRINISFSGEGIYSPSAIALTPDQEFMYIADRMGRFQWSFWINAAGDLQDGEPFCRLEMPEMGLYSESTGITITSAGWPFFVTPLGIQGFEAAGRQAQILNSPVRGTITAAVFVSGDSNWLYTAVGSQLFRRPVKVNAVTADTKIKPSAPPL